MIGFYQWSALPAAAIGSARLGQSLSRWRRRFDSNPAVLDVAQTPKRACGVRATAEKAPETSTTMAFSPDGCVSKIQQHDSNYWLSTKCKGHN
jgi:hypothetical protein